MASPPTLRLNPLRSRHVSQGTLVLPISATPQSTKIAVAAARPSIVITTTNVTPFSLDGAISESETTSQTGTFLSVSPKAFTHTPSADIPHLPRIVSTGSAPDVLRASQRSQRATDEGSPTACRRRNQPSMNAMSNDVTAFNDDALGSPPPMDKTLSSARIKAKQAGEINPHTQYTRTQSSQNQYQYPYQVGDDRSRAAALRSTGLAYDDVVETEAVENLCLLLGLNRNDVRRLRRQFNDEDGDNMDSITQGAFFYLIGEERHNLSRRLFRLADMPPTQSRITFDQFLTIVATFATFTEAELLKFFYDVYCSDSESGAMLTSEIQSLGDELRAVNKGLAKNITVATKKMVSSRNVMAVAVAASPLTNQHQQEGNTAPEFSFADFEKLVKKNLAAFYPLIRMQRNLRSATVSEAFWAAKTREKQAVQATLAYMKAHQGHVPELSIKDRLITSVFRLETSGSRVRALAKKIYAATNEQQNPRTTD